MKSCEKILFGTHEWADENFNFINGCTHDCKYCYSKEMAIRFKRKTSKTWKQEEVRSGYLNKRFSKRDGTIMFPSSHDITPDHLDKSIQVLSKLLRAGNRLLVVTKPHIVCIERICREFEGFKDQILFRFTIGSVSSEELLFWEPGAPDFDERYSCLKLAYDKGFETSVSCEPMLDMNPSKVIDALLPYITETIWMGKANFLFKRMRTNGITDSESIERAQRLIDWQSDPDNILSLYCKYEDISKVKWKESIKKVLSSLETVCY